MKLKWKDIYNENKQRRFCNITGIKEENVEIESNPLRTLKERKYIVIISFIIIVALIIWSFKSDIRSLLMVLAFFIVVGLCFFVFNYFKFICLKDGIYVKFGFQQGKFKYENVKSVYLSTFNDYSFLLPSKRIYSLVIRYVDNNNRIKELSFPNYFLKPDDVRRFLGNFNIEEVKDEKYVQYENFKVLKKIGKILLFIAFVILVFVVYFFYR